ncbi:hypothetical protein [Streptomyces sp. NWU49]|uniref:hypothetical protein n=1 Tax=Streptomyces sp. NWU49 TaxID=2201153 RepID=UPI0015E801F9|nr:hypothetical protein [Streptomyces sp. NWU49]
MTTRILHEGAGRTAWSTTRLSPDGRYPAFLPASAQPAPGGTDGRAAGCAEHPPPAS